MNHQYERHGRNTSPEDVVDPRNFGESEVSVTEQDFHEEAVDPNHLSLEQQRLLDARAAFENAKAKLQEATTELLALWIKHHGTFLFLDDEDVTRFPNTYNRQLEALEERIALAGGAPEPELPENDGSIFGSLRALLERGKKMLGGDTSVASVEDPVVAQLKKEHEVIVNTYNEIQTAFSRARRKLDTAITHYARLNKSTGEFLTRQLDPTLRFENQVRYDIQPLYKSSYTMTDLRGFLEAHNIPTPPPAEQFDQLAAK